MGVATTGGTVGVGIATLLSATGLLKPTPSMPEFYQHVEITPSGQMFSDWTDERTGEEVNQCSFWNATYHYAPRACNSFAVSRLSAASAQRAVDRAVICAADYESSCILSGEIGFDFPAAFLYDAEQGFRMILAPRMITIESQPATTQDPSNPSTAAPIFVRVADPSDTAPSTILRMNKTVTAEFLTPGTRRVSTETFAGADAYCIQLLRASVSPACWNQLD